MPCGTFCYKVMSFRLKNVKATHQMAMMMLFHDMMHKEIEVYVDDRLPSPRKERVMSRFQGSCLRD
jgi:hypothetical protein